MRSLSKLVFFYGAFLGGFGAAQADDTVEYRITIQGIPLVVRIHSSHLDAKYAANVTLSSQRGDRGFVEEVNDKGEPMATRFQFEGPRGQSPSGAFLTYLQASLERVAKAQWMTGISIPVIKDIPPEKIALMIGDEIENCAMFAKLLLQERTLSAPLEFGFITRDRAVFEAIEQMMDKKPSIEKQARSHSNGELGAIETTLRENYAAHPRSTMKMLVERILEAGPLFGASAPEPWALDLLRAGVDRDALSEARFEELLAIHLKIVGRTWPAKDDLEAALIHLFNKSPCNHPLTAEKKSA